MVVDSSKLHDSYNTFFSLNFPGFFLDSARGYLVSPIRLRRICPYFRLPRVVSAKDFLFVWGK